LELPVHVNEPNHRAIIATSWGGMLAVLLAMLMLSPLQYAMNGQYEGLTKVLREDPGPLGLQVLIVMLCLNALVQVTASTSPRSHRARYLRCAMRTPHKTNLSISWIPSNISSPMPIAMCAFKFLYIQ
jgi:hypothetical protein